MLFTLLISVAAFTVLFIYLLMQTVSLRQVEADIEEMQQRLEI